MPEIITRRRFLSFLAAPAIVHASNLMPIKALRDPRYDDVRANPVLFIEKHLVGSNYAELSRITRKYVVPRFYKKVFLNGIPIYCGIPPEQFLVDS